MCIYVGSLSIIYLPNGLTCRSVQNDSTLVQYTGDIHTIHNKWMSTRYIKMVHKVLRVTFHAKFLISCSVVYWNWVFGWCCRQSVCVCIVTNILHNAKFFGLCKVFIVKTAMSWNGFSIAMNPPFRGGNTKAYIYT